jgi:hypothetical protein
MKCSLVGTAPITQGGVIDEYGAIVKRWFTGDNHRNSEKSLNQCHFVYDEYHRNLPAPKAEACQ